MPSCRTQSSLMPHPAVKLLGYGHAPYRAPHLCVASPGLYQSFAVNLGAHAPSYGVTLFQSSGCGFLATGRVQPRNGTATAPAGTGNLRRRFQPPFSAQPPLSIPAGDCYHARMFQHPENCLQDILQAGSFRVSHNSLKHIPSPA